MSEINLYTGVPYAGPGSPGPTPKTIIYPAGYFDHVFNPPSVFKWEWKKNAAQVAHPHTRISNYKWFQKLEAGSCQTFA